VLGALLLALLGAAAQAQPVGLQRGVVFDQYSARSSSAELVRRNLSPLAAARLAIRLARAGEALGGQSVNLADERFLVYAPKRAPPRGYAVMVFVPPWPDARLPRGWAPVLDREGVIFVSAARSGNDASILDRREPLAVLAAENIVARYPVDPERIYIAGFSGGSRVAMRIALAYPDVFQGALLNAGADPIGNPETTLPPRDLFLRVQASTRLVYVTGARDEVNLGKDADSRRSMSRWCVFSTAAQIAPRLGHEPLDAGALAAALAGLDTPTRPDPARLAACRAALDAQLARALESVETRRANGQQADADRMLRDIDTRFGGWAASRVSDLLPGEE